MVEVLIVVPIAVGVLSGVYRCYLIPNRVK
jgi:hypothetical protein